MKKHRVTFLPAHTSIEVSEGSTLAQVAQRAEIQSKLSEDLEVEIPPESRLEGEQIMTGEGKLVGGQAPRRDFAFLPWPEGVSGIRRNSGFTSPASNDKRYPIPKLHTI
jgi:hypothetical protein